MEEETQLYPIINNSRRNSINQLNSSSGIFEESRAGHGMEVTLAWKDLSVFSNVSKRRKNHLKCIINEVTGAVKPGSLVALMGPSGAGKSTLMTTLAFRNSGDLCVDGEILMNGRSVNKGMKKFSAFMPQDDVFVEALTVIEHLTIMARFKLDRTTSQKEQTSKILFLVQKLGLSKCLNTKIGAVGTSKALSGGEKKRLALATELLTDPAILFCDEPTSGLDSYSAQKIITILNIMAYAGKTIICTIHQPSSEVFAMFSQLIILSEGRIAFMGSTASALEFFEQLGYACPSSYNPADYYIKILAMTPGHEDNSRQAIKTICNQFLVSDYNKEIDVIVSSELYLWQKLYWLTYRWLLSSSRNSSLYFAKFAQRIILSFVLGLCFFGTTFLSPKGIQNIQGVIFLIVSENSFFPMYAVVNEFPQMYPLFLREHKTGLYSAPVYYLSRIIAMLPGLIIDPVLFVIIIYWLSGLRATTYAFLMTTLAGVLTYNAATACGLLFSNAFDTVGTAMAYLVPFDFMLLVTSGLFINLRTLPVFFSLLKYLSWLMYSTEAIFIVQWKDVKNITCDASDQDVPCLTTGSEILEKYFFSEANLGRDLWSLFILCVTFHVLGCFCLWWKTRGK